jgi:hypothetical protein
MNLLERPSPHPLVIAELQAASAQLIDRILRHPFFAGCVDGSVTLGQLRAVLIQHGK